MALHSGGVVLAAVLQEEEAPEFAPEALRADLGIVAAAEQPDFPGLEFAPVELRVDPGVVLAVIRRGGLTLRFTRWRFAEMWRWYLRRCSRT